MKNFICPECGTQNEPQYIYCKNCGVRLVPEQKSQENAQSDNSSFNNTSDAETDSQTFNGNYATKAYSTPVCSEFVVDTIEGVSTDDIVTFVGTKAGKIVPKFSKMEISRSRVSWCWPPALLGIAFGPIGTAIWFFYRKMYKIAIILVAIGVLYGGITGVLNGYFAAATGDFVNSIIEELPNELQSLYGSYFGFLENIKIPNYTPVYEIMGDFISIASFIFGGVFSLHFYKKHTVSKIEEYKLSNIDPRYYKLGLASVGGTSTGMAWLGIFIYLFADGMFDTISFFVSNYMV